MGPPTREAPLSFDVFKSRSISRSIRTLVIQGVKREFIAQQLDITPRCVGAHISRLVRLGYVTQAQADTTRLTPPSRSERVARQLRAAGGPRVATSPSVRCLLQEGELSPEALARLRQEARARQTTEGALLLRIVELLHTSNLYGAVIDDD